MTGVPQAIASIMTRPNGSGQSIGNSRARGAGKKRLLPRLVGFADELDFLAVDVRFELLLEVSRLRARYLGGDPQRHPGSTCDAHRVFGALVDRQPPKKGQVRTRLIGRPKEILRQTVLDRIDPVRLQKRPALVVGDRDERGFRKGSDDVGEPGKVEAAMHRREIRDIRPAQHGKGQPVDVRVDQVEAGSVFSDSSTSIAQAALGSTPIRPNRRARGHTG
ncbi:hypothetical protein ABIF79_005532 [Bradyrhizobium japonicum]